MAFTADELKVIAHMRLAKLRGEGTQHDPFWIDWHQLFRRDTHEQWLVTDLWPVERQIHIHAARKTGKSLISLWIASNLAIGRDPFSGFPRKPIKVAYLDYEMTEDDLLERIEAMGFTPDQLAGNLFYALHPVLAPLDTKQGGEALMEVLTANGIEAVVLDTFSRVVVGDENSNDTYRAFYKWTGALLKAAGIALMRLDHEGHHEGRSRGASAKADDVDVVWQLRLMDGGLQFVRKASRIAWVPEIVSTTQAEPLAFSRTGQTWPAGTMDKVRELDEAEVPLDLSRRKVIQLLKEKGVTPGKTIVLNAAIQYRNNRIIGI